MFSIDGLFMSLGSILSNKLRSALTTLGIGTTMIIAGIVTLIGMGVSMAWAPETRGMTLGEAAALPGKATKGAPVGHSAVN